MSRVTEEDVAQAVMKIASLQSDKIATFDRIRDEGPSYLNLSNEDLKISSVRKNEPMWHQIIRNIQSHHDVEDNYIYLGYIEHVPDSGYRITASGEVKLKSL